jgi:type I restriction-modification system DNA methylase subunit
MEREFIDKALSLLKDLSDKNLKIEEILSEMSLSSRNDLLREISRDIVEKNNLVKEHGLSNEDTCEPISSDPELLSINTLLDNLVSNIEKNPSKKVIYLRLFLDRFHDISDQDKNVIIQSVKEEDTKGLKAKMLSLINVFKLEI